MQENPLAAGLGLPREPAPLSLVIFGASGDLTRRKLIPALFSLHLKGSASRMRITGFARRDWTTESFRARVRGMLDEEEAPAASAAEKDSFAARVDFVRSSFENPDGYAALAGHPGAPPNRLFYLATPPDEYQVVLERLGAAGLADQSRGFARVVVEKPLGRDLASARALNEAFARVFPEREIYRIDHYLGKETVQNIMALRLGNEIFEPVWNNRYVDHVQITMAETIGVESRGHYYEGAGALRDMIQNHMLQLLSLVAMEPPVDLAPDSVRDEKVKVLKSIKPIGAEGVAAQTVRAQYAAGTADGVAVPGYRQEQGVAPGSQTETYAALRVQLDSWRWAGVPFLLRTGKRLSRRATEISVHFKRPPLDLFGRQVRSTAQPNVLALRIQPREGITLGFNAKIPGRASDMRTVAMDFAYGSAFADDLPDAYEKLLLDAMVGDSTLFMRTDEVDSAWKFVTGVLDGWAAPGAPPLVFYRAGSSGPEDASRLLGTEERRWRRL
jgi:glucose-6-phosphate 1-dehydrogenase